MSVTSVGTRLKKRLPFLLQRLTIVSSKNGKLDAFSSQLGAAWYGDDGPHLELSFLRRVGTHQPRGHKNPDLGPDGEDEDAEQARSVKTVKVHKPVAKRDMDQTVGPHPK